MATVKPTIIGQAIGTTEELNQYKGRTDAPGQIVWNETEKRFVGFDGVQVGGYPMSKKQEVDDVKQEVDDVKQEVDDVKQEVAANQSELETALKELIVEYGGTVPTE